MTNSGANVYLGDYASEDMTRGTSYSEDRNNLLGGGGGGGGGLVYPVNAEL